MARSYTRHLKTGKSVRVKAYYSKSPNRKPGVLKLGRTPLGMGLPAAHYKDWYRKRSKAAVFADKQKQAYEKSVGRTWTKPFDPQFAYTGTREGDKELLASLRS